MRNREYDYLQDELESDPHAWRDYASCLSAPDHLERVMFPWGKNPPSAWETEDFLQTYCDTCPVAQRCLDFALETESEGIWGGVDLTPPKVSFLKKLRETGQPVTVEQAKGVLGRGKE